MSIFTSDFFVLVHHRLAGLGPTSHLFASSIRSRSICSRFSFDRHEAAYLMCSFTFKVHEGTHSFLHPFFFHTSQNLSGHSLSQARGLSQCERGEGVQGVLTLFCSGAAQVCHDDRVVELKEQLEVEEEDRGQTGGRGRRRKWRGESRRVRHVDDHADGSVNALRT